MAKVKGKGLLSKQKNNTKKKEVTTDSLEAASKFIKDPYAQGGSKYTGYYKGFYWINGEAHNNLSDDEIPQMQEALSKQQMKYQNKAQAARNKEQNILKNQLKQQNNYYRDQLALSEKQVQATEAYSALYSSYLDEQASNAEATQARATAEAERSTTIANEERSRTVAKTNFMQTKARQRVDSRMNARSRRPGTGLLSGFITG